MDITWKMCYFLLVIFSLISASAAEMSRATTTREFRLCFPQNWVNADQVRVSCNYTQIAQYCSPDRSCGNKTSPGVSLEKGKDGVWLTIINCSCDSRSCEAQSYISDKEHKDTFTVNVCNQPTSTSPSPGSTSTLPSPGSTSTSTTSGSTSTLPSPGKEPLSGSFEAVRGLIVGLIIVGLIIVGLIIYFCYKKVKCFRKAVRDHLPCMNRAPEEKQDTELEEVMTKKNLLRENNMKEVSSATLTLM